MPHAGNGRMYSTLYMRMHSNAATPIPVDDGLADRGHAQTRAGLDSSRDRRRQEVGADPAAQLSGVYPWGPAPARKTFGRRRRGAVPGAVQRPQARLQSLRARGRRRHASGRARPPPPPNTKAASPAAAKQCKPAAARQRQQCLAAARQLLLRCCCWQGQRMLWSMEAATHRPAPPATTCCQLPASASSAVRQRQLP